MQMRQLISTRGQRVEKVNIYRLSLGFEQWVKNKLSLVRLQSL